MKKLIILIPFFISTIGIAQNYTKSETIEDLTFLLESIEKYNPALKVYNANFNEDTKKILMAVPENSIDLFEHFSLVSKIVCASNEGHFDIGNWQDNVHSGFINNTFEYMPLSIKIVDNRVYIWNDYTAENQLNRGDEIIEINGIKIDEILSEIGAHIPSDGEIKTYLNDNIELGFNWMYYLFIERPSTFEIKLKKYKIGDIAVLTIPALNRKTIELNYEKNYSELIVEPEKSSVNDLYEFKIEGQVAVLKLKSFYYKLAEDFNVSPKKLYKEIFSQIDDSRVQTLIVDLRNNTGGRKEFSNELLPYIMSERKRGIFRSSVSWEGKIKNYKIPKPKKTSFQGKIYVVVNGRTFSEGSVVARLFREYTDATIIGEETGTRYEGVAAGSKQSIVLPNSELSINIPRYHLKFPPSIKQSTSNRGLIPDINVTYSIEDLIEGRDLEMEFLKESIH